MKKWYVSKTIQFNIAIAIVAMVQMNLPIVQEQLGNHYGWVLMGISAIGIILRAITTKKIVVNTKVEAKK